MIKTTILACALALGVTAGATASGTYMPPTGRIPSKRGDTMDSAMYALGQKTFEGKAVSAGAGDAATQRASLVAIQAKVPSGSGDVTKLAGKITDEQVKALQYFVSKRFGL
jgi:hypothetical protein